MVEDVDKMFERERIQLAREEEREKIKRRLATQRMFSEFKKLKREEMKQARPKKKVRVQKSLLKKLRKFGMQKTKFNIPRYGSTSRVKLKGVRNTTPSAKKVKREPPKYHDVFFR